MTDFLISKTSQYKSRVSVLSQRALSWAIKNLELRPGDSGVTIDSEHAGQMERELNAAGMTVDMQ